jgi:nucleoside-diphosphate-sugar epimerase
MTAFVSAVDEELGRRLVRLLEEEGVQTVEADPDSTEDTRRAVQGADVVYLLDDADGTSGQPFRAMRQANLDKPARLVQHVKEGQRVVLLSSVQVYSPVHSPSGWPITEAHPRRAHGGWPTRVYGQQKIEAENLLARSADERGHDYVILRSSIRYGTGQGLSERLTAALRERPGAAIAAYQGLGVMQWTAVEDVARALVLAGSSVVTESEAFNIAGDEPSTVWEMAEQVHGRQGIAGSRVLDRGRRPVPEKIDTAKARAMLGWAPQHRLDEWLGDQMPDRTPPRGAMPAAGRIPTPPMGRAWFGGADGVPTMSPGW